MLYESFELRIQPGLDGDYEALVTRSLAGDARADFVLPFSDAELAAFLWDTVGATRQIRRTTEPGQPLAVQDFGTRLYEAVFGGDVGICLLRSLDEAMRRKTGLRIRLRIDERLPALADLPWEYLYAPQLGRFLALSHETPLVRYLEVPRLAPPLPVSPPLTVLALLSSPQDMTPLMVEREWTHLQAALQGLEQRGLVRLERLPAATLEALQGRLRSEAGGGVHMLHFVGHGFFDSERNLGGLVFEDEQGRSQVVSAAAMGMLLHDHEALRLVFLNACEGASSGRSDSFAGVAQQLVQQGVTAVAAMQFPISDQAAVVLSQEFYRAVAAGHPVDAALSEARKAIPTQATSYEWGAPVLFSRSDDNRLFSPTLPRSTKRTLAVLGLLLSVLLVVALVLVSADAISRQRQPGGVLAAVWPAATPTPAPVTPMPNGFFNIAMAQFAEIDSTGHVTATQASRELSDWLYVAIQDQLNQFPDLSANYRGPQEIGTIAGLDANERAVNAEQTAELHNANILIYGLAQSSDGRYQAEPQFYVSYDGFGSGAEIAGSNRLGSPVTFTLPLLSNPSETSQRNRELKARRQVLQNVVAGLIYYYQGQYDRAWNQFDQALYVPGWPDGQGQEVVYLLQGAARLRTYGAAAPAEQREKVLREANEAFARAYALRPDYARAQLGLGAIALAQAELTCPKTTACSEPALQSMREKLAEALTWYTASITAGDQLQSSHVPVKAAFGLGQVYLAGYKRDMWPADQARDHLQQVVDFYNTNPAPDLRWFAGHAQATLGWLAGEDGDYEATTRKLYEAIDILSGMPGPSGDWIAYYWSLAGAAEHELGRSVQARRAYRQAIDFAERVGPKAVAFGRVDLEAWKTRLAELEEGAP